MPTADYILGMPADEIISLLGKRASAMRRSCPLVMQRTLASGERECRARATRGELTQASLLPWRLDRRQDYLRMAK